MRLSFVRLYLALMVGIACGCEKAPTPTSRRAGPPLTPYQPVATNATVRYVALEGGCWVLDTPQGSYDPLSVPSQYQVDGMLVSVVMHGDTGVVSLCWMGDPLVSLDSIRAR
jgi:hypothetical protein